MTSVKIRLIVFHNFLSVHRTRSKGLFIGGGPQVSEVTHFGV